jgi:hypothetical protein
LTIINTAHILKENMKKNFFEWIAYFALFIWQILQNLVGLGFWIYFKLRGDIETVVKNKYSRVYKSKYMRGGISLGSFAFVSINYAKRETIVRHEQGHMHDSKTIGPLYVFIIGIPSLLNAFFKFTKCYYDFYTEKLANHWAGVGLDKNCRLYIKDKGALD